MQYKPFSIGNLKLGKDTIIFNITSAMECPSAKLGLCQVPAGKCYALKAERMYPSARGHRAFQTQYWDSHTPEEIAEDIRKIISRKRKVKIKYFRLSESGDFRDQADVEKFFKIASLVPEIKFYAYTARKDLDFSNAPDNCTINGTEFMAHNKIHIVPKKEFEKMKEEKKPFLCKKDCRICALCKSKRGIEIIFPLH